MEDNQHSKNKVVTAGEVALLLRLPLNTVYELAAKGKLRGIKCGRQWRFLETDVVNYLHGIAAPGFPVVQSSDRRRYVRLNSEIHTKVQRLLTSPQGIEEAGLIRNLSEGGVLLAVSSNIFAIGDPVRIVIAIPEYDRVSLVIEGRVVHRQVNSHITIGVKFRNISQTNQEIIRHYVG